MTTIDIRKDSVETIDEIVFYDIANVLETMLEEF